MKSDQEKISLRAEGVSQTRRRLASSAFAAPIIVTLGAPGSAAAATLSALDRLNNESQLASTDKPLLAGTNGSVNWKRGTSVTIYNVKTPDPTGGNTTVKAIKDTDNNFYALAYPYKQVIPLSGGTGIVTQWGSGYKLNIYTLSTDGKKFVLAAAGTKGSPVTASACTSLCVAP